MRRFRHAMDEEVRGRYVGGALGKQAELTEAASLGSLPGIHLLLMGIVSTSICTRTPVSIPLSRQGHHGVRHDVAWQRDCVTHSLDSSRETLAAYVVLSMECAVQ